MRVFLSITVEFSPAIFATQSSAQRPGQSFQKLSTSQHTPVLFTHRYGSAKVFMYENFDSFAERSQFEK
jgi:hypothetical protein